MPVSNNLRAGNILIQNMKSEYIKAYEKFEKVDEGASEGVKINSFQELENFLKNNKEGLPYSKVEIPSSKSSLNVQIKLMSNKKVSIDESLDSWISLDYDISTGDNYIRGWAASGKKDTSSLFAGVKKNENATFSSMYEIVNMCNPVDMYNSCVKKTTTEISYISPIIVSTFDLCVKKILRGNHTLSVHYDAVLGKFVYTYNPDFVLLSSIDEFVLNESKYNSFQDCYCYVLSFLICHEMMHLIHHNVTSGIEDEGNTSHFTDNLIYDSFINCKLSRLLKRNSFSRDNYYGSPVLNGGVNDEFVLRSEHNKGLKSYSTAYDIQNAIAEFLKKTLNISQDYSDAYSGKNINTLGFAGADFILKIKISKDSDEMRASSGILKKITQGICKLLSEGSMFAAQEGLSIQEVESDLDVLPTGTLVKMRASGEVCIISGYESSSGIYSLNKTVISAVNKVPNEDGGSVCTPTYSDSGENKGKFRRTKFEEFSPESWTEYDEEQVYQQSLSDEDLQTPEDSGLGGGMQMPEASKEKVFHIGDIVWVRRKKSFGRISKMENGVFTLEEVEEVGVKKLDDSDFHVNESASGNRVVLKERVFAPTGRVLGEFTVSDIETFDKVYKDSNQSDGESGSNDLSTVPPPKDDDPLEKNGSGEDSSSKNSDNESGDSEGGSGEGSQESNSSSSSETSEEEDSSGSSTSSGGSSVDSESGESSDGSEGSDSRNSNRSNSNSVGSNSSDLEDSELGSSGSSDDSGNSSEEGSSDVSSQSSGNSDLGSYEGSEESTSSKQSAGNSSGGMSGDMSGSEEGPYEDEEDLDDGSNLSDNSGYSESALSEAIKQISETSSESSNVKKEEEIKSGKGESSSSSGLETSRNSTNEERSAMKDMMDAATEEAKKIRLNSPNSNKQSEADGDLENEILSSIGGSSLTKNISFKGVKDWKKKLERLLDSALGFDIQTDPNKINKKVADAPPGVEEMYPEIKNIAVLLDCSGSMGIGEFVKVVNHLNNLCAARKMNKTYFHLICWGTDDKKEVSKWYWKVKGSKAFFKCIKSNGAEKSWNTNLNPAIELITTKGKKFDAIIILTDGQIFDTPSDDTKRFFKKYKERVIWALTDLDGIRYVKGFDPTCMSKERVVVFKK